MPLSYCKRCQRETEFRKVSLWFCMACRECGFKRPEVFNSIDTDNYFRAGALSWFVGVLVLLGLVAAFGLLIAMILKIV